MEAAETAPDGTVRIRVVHPSDEAFIADTWRKSLRLSGRNRRRSIVEVNHEFDRDVRLGVLAEPDTKFAIACEAASPASILGWLCYTPGIPHVHYAYVRSEERRQGLFRGLLAAIGVRDGGMLAYTGRPQEYAHRFSRRPAGAEEALLAKAGQCGILAKYLPVAEFLGRLR